MTPFNYMTVVVIQVWSVLFTCTGLPSAFIQHHLTNGLNSTIGFMDAFFSFTVFKPTCVMYA